MCSVIQEGSNASPRRTLRIFATWRKNLCHFNKARDNHFKFLGEHHDLSLVVPANCVIGDHIPIQLIHLIRVQCPPNLLGFVWFYLVAIFFFLRMHYRQSFDVVWAVIGEEPIGWLIKLVSFPRVTLIYDLWDIPGSAVVQGTLSPKELARRVYNVFISIFLRYGDLAIVGVVPKGLERFHILPNRMVSSENGVLLKRFDPERSWGGEEFWDGLNGEVKFLYHGYLHETRGAFDIVKAICKGKKGGLDASLLLVGPSDPNTKNHIQAIIASHNLQDSIRIFDSVDSESVPGIISGADICVCPLWGIEKYRWIYPVKVYEYLAMGKPVIASNLPGTAHVVQHGINGLLYPPGDIAALQDSIIRLTEDDRLYKSLAEAARKSVADKDWQLILEYVIQDVTRRLAQ